MKGNNKKIQEQILFYARKLNPVKQIEVLDFIKWLWGGPRAEEDFTEKEIEKIDSLSRKKGGKKFKSWEDAKKYLEDLM